MTRDFFEREASKQGYTLIAGVDEAGRGPLAGPVYAAAVIFNGPVPDLNLRDSKTLSAKRREELFEEIQERAVSIGVGKVSHEEIDSINILKAALKAMKQAVEALNPPPDLVLIDGNLPINTHHPQKTIVKGDNKSYSIAAASIIAKVSRDRIMEEYHTIYPEYGFKSHKGYGTREHLNALKRYGPLPIHRRTFRGVNAGG
ncbi:MAG: ribonuclease HII [Thermodesulfobacteriota bacterium]